MILLRSLQFTSPINQGSTLGGKSMELSIDLTHISIAKEPPDAEE